MKTIAVVDTDKKHLNKCRKMLTSYENELKLVFFQYPEEAIAYLDMEHPAVLVCELNMSVMSGRELFNVYELLSPETVLIAMEEVEDIKATLQTINETGVFKLILKPFFFVEDLAKPILSALTYYERKESKKRELLEEIHDIKLDSSYLEYHVEQNKIDCRQFSDTISGLLKGNLYFNQQLEHKDKKIVYKYFNDLYRVFLKFQIFETKIYDSYEKYLVRLFHQPEKNRNFYIQNQLGKMTDKQERDIGYTIFLLAYLASGMLKRYWMKVVVKKEERYVTVRFYCEPEEEKGFEYRRMNAKLHEFLLEMCDKLLISLTFKVVKGEKEDPFSAKVYI